MVSCTNFSYFV